MTFLPSGNPEAMGRQCPFAAYLIFTLYCGPIMSIERPGRLNLLALGLDLLALSQFFVIVA
jgi:hypothetical protein